MQPLQVQVGTLSGACSVDEVRLAGDLQLETKPSERHAAQDQSECPCFCVSVKATRQNGSEDSQEGDSQSDAEPSRSRKQKAEQKRDHRSSEAAKSRESCRRESVFQRAPA